MKNQKIKPKQEKSNHLKNFGESTTISACTSERKLKKCYKFRPCKQVQCISCRAKRRDYFLSSGVLQARRLGLNMHAVVSLPARSTQDAWMKLSTLTSFVSKHLVNRIGSHMRVASIGRSKRTPHIHFLIHSDRSERFNKLVEKSLPDSSVFIDEIEAYDLHGLLGYWYDKNFVHSSLDNEKIKGVRLLSGTRGMSYGHPTARHWKKLKDILGVIE